MRVAAKSFRANVCGNVVIMFGAFGSLAMLVMGMAIEYSRISSQKTQMDAAADAASLAGLRLAVTQPVKTGDGNVNVPATIAKAEKQAKDTFDVAYSAQKANTRVVPNYSINYDPKTTVWKSAFSYSAQVPSTFGRLIGRSDFQVAGKSIANEAIGAMNYIDAQLLLDVSSSMGIGATAADIAKMVSLNGCAFGCHEPAYKATYYDLPKANGVKMRIDVLRTATQNLITTAKTADGGAGTIRMGVDVYNDKVATLAAMTSSLDSISAVVNTIDLPTYEDASDFKSAILAMNAKMTASGNGSSAANARKILFIVTDGVEDQIYRTTANTFDTEDAPGSWGNTGAIRPSVCNALKSKGIIIAIVYTTYVKFTGWQYDSLIKPFDTKIAPKLAACASDGFFAEAESGAAIEKAMNDLFKKSLVATQARLTN